MRSFIRSLLISTALLASASPAFATAHVGGYVLVQDDGGRRGHDRREGNREDRVLPLDVIIRGLMSSYPGKPLDARGPMQRGDRLIYEIVWLTENGRQIVIIVDATTGQVMRVHGLH